MIVYEPAEDSYLLESIISKYVKNKSVIEIGAGSGILSKKAKEQGAKSIVAVDINPDSINLLKKEKLKGIKLIQSDLFKKVKGKFDLIICNPPYLPEDKQEDNESSKITTGGKIGDEFILRFLTQSVNHINKEGIILLLVSSLTPKKRIVTLLKKLKLKKTTIATKKLFFEILEVWEIKDLSN
ncbi:methyltransferase domain-containing protein [Candidatus Pacearchaeota archaeon]|nr:methyltransferase domain-containing protein [Candidatus Pacearchaeota archaeon]